MKYNSICMMVGVMLLASCSENKTDKTTDSVSADTQVVANAYIVLRKANEKK